MQAGFSDLHKLQQLNIIGTYIVFQLDISGLPYHQQFDNSGLHTLHQLDISGLPYLQQYDNIRLQLLHQCTSSPLRTNGYLCTTVYPMQKLYY
jgi:hypothetical protein